MKHTKGPWIYDIHEHSFYIFTKADMDMVADGDPDDIGIARMRGVGRGADTEEQEANARLIAAAPELLEASALMLDAAISWHNFHAHPTTGIQCDAICDAIPRLRKAIAKAESGQ